ncbi:hypothetical protein [Marinobacter shengliensis]|uniref:hypothetical protein n=1 Tax=Marinobacter shengliensis TaxID=1389223 RepID=UPI0011085185|nr:hypothetical protein [Marinobacter shengliensis]
MPKRKALSETHQEIASKLDFLADSPAYKSHSVIVWRVGGADYIRAAQDLSDMGLVGYESELAGREPIANISISRGQLPTLVQRVEELSGA